MKNPFAATGNAVAGMFRAADQCDFYDPTILKAGAVLVTPIVAPVAFMAAFFQKGKQA